MIALKNKEQIDGIRESCHLLAKTFDYLEKQVQPGVTTKKINSLADEFIRDHKGVPAFLGYGGFPAAICASVNDTVIHGIPNSKPLKEGDLLGLDMGIILEGYYSDRAMTYGVGTISPEAGKLMEVTRLSLFKGIQAIKPGGRIKDISKAISEVVKAHGYGIVSSYCGHGVGLDVHEDPQIPNNYPHRGPNPRIKPGMVLAIEPMINAGVSEVEVLDDDWTVKTLDRQLSAHFEHTVAVHKESVEILTLSEREILPC